MIKLNIHEAKTHLSRHLGRLIEGETILLCKRNVPIAEIRPVRQNGKSRRIGLSKGEFSVTEEFFKPLPDEIVGAFSGGNK